MTTSYQVALRMTLRLTTKLADYRRIGLDEWVRLYATWYNPRSGSRVSRRRRAHDNKCAGSTVLGWMIRPLRPTIAKVRAKKLSSVSAKTEVPDAVAPNYSTASRRRFATLGEFPRYFNRLKIYKTHKLIFRARPALVLLESFHIAPLPQPCHGWGGSGLANTFYRLPARISAAEFLAAIPVRRAGKR